MKYPDKEIKLEKDKEHANFFVGRCVNSNELFTLKDQVVRATVYWWSTTGKNKYNLKVIGKTITL